MRYYRESTDTDGPSFNTPMVPSKKMKTSDIKTIICFMPIRFSVGTKNVPTCLTARRRKSRAKRPTVWLFIGCEDAIRKKAAYLH